MLKTASVISIVICSVDAQCSYNIEMDSINNPIRNGIAANILKGAVELVSVF